jgi:hypothetical protein
MNPLCKNKKTESSPKRIGKEVEESYLFLGCFCSQVCADFFGLGKRWSESFCVLVRCRQHCSHVSFTVRKNEPYDEEEEESSHTSSWYRYSRDVSHPLQWNSTLIAMNYTVLLWADQQPLRAYQNISQWLWQK